MNEEVKKFWYSEKMLNDNLTNLMEEAAPVEGSAQEAGLPDDIMPDVEIPSRPTDQETEVLPAKKKSK
jgi:hypothetical protein